MTNKKLIKSFLKARVKSSIKPILNGVYINKEEGIMACTDSYRLHQIATPNNSFPTGVYNLDTLEVIEEQYPDYKQLLNKLVYIEHTVPLELKKRLSADCQYNNYRYNIKHIEDALDIIDSADIIIKMSPNGCLYIGSTITDKCFALVMCLNSQYSDTNK